MAIGTESWKRAFWAGKSRANNGRGWKWEIKREREREKNEYYKKLLRDVEDAIEDDITRQYIMDQHEKGKTESEYNQNRSKQIDLLLEIAGNYSYSEFVTTIRKSKNN